MCFWVGIQEDSYGQTLHLEIIGMLQVPMRIVSKTQFSKSQLVANKIMYSIHWLWVEDFQSLFNIYGMKSQGLCWLFTAGPILWLHHQSHYHGQWVSSWFSCWEASTRHRRREKPGYFFLVPPLLWHHFRADSYRSLPWTIRPAGVSLDPLTLRVAMSGSWQFLGAASLNLTLCKWFLY